MSHKFNFIVMDANQHVERQQVLVRKIVGERINLTQFKRRSPLPLPPAVPRAIPPNNKTKETEEDLAA
jgi:hypothetical protein